jgi:hypothetical protein
MSRKYQDTKTYNAIRYKRQKDGSHKKVWEMFNRTYIRNGLKLIHIGKDVWRIGRHKVTGENKHQVIYGPDDKEYHLYGTDVEFVNTAGDFERITEPNHTIWRINRSENIALEARVKIYILTHILDQKENWSFDLSIVPPVGKLKVIYANGTVKNIDFDGEFKDTFIRYRWADILSAEAKDLGNMIPAFGYRIPN